MRTAFRWFLRELLRHPAIAGIGGRELIRRWRECDFFLQNAAAVSLGLMELADHNEGGADDVRRNNNRQEPWLAVGLMYGGLELPAIASVIGSRRDFPIDIGLLRVSTYNSQRASKQIRRGESGHLNELNHPRPLFIAHRAEWVGPDGEDGWSSGNVPLAGRRALILDDNCTTGITLQVARDVMSVRGADVLGAIVVRFPGSNRYAHMNVAGRGCPDPEMMFSFVRGLVAPSPYTRLLVSETNYPRPVFGSDFNV